MKNILHLFKRDVQNVSRSVIGMVVVMGLIIVPCLYAWFNIAGSWDPYGNTGNLKIAVVNTDEGYESDLIPVEVNVGENVTATLRGNENFDWVVLNDRDKAIEGVKSGAYYAAVVIPKTFSADMMTLFSTEVKHADIEFYENQKANAIAQIVTEKGSSAVQSQVNETFTKTITTIGLKTVSSLLDYMAEHYDAVVIESFGVGGLPSYESGDFYSSIEKWISMGKVVVMTTQVTQEGSNMSVYEVGQKIKNAFGLIESYDMTLEATVTKLMWILGQTKDHDKVREMFYETINHDILWNTGGR